MEFKPLITLLAIVNPPAIIPFFIYYTQGFSSAQRRHTVVVASLTAFLVIAEAAKTPNTFCDGLLRQRRLPSTRTALGWKIFLAPRCCVDTSFQNRYTFSETLICSTSR